MNTYIAGTTIRIEVEIKDVDGEYVDFDGSSGEDIEPVITISTGDVTEIIDEDMAKSTTGKYYYDWESTTDDTEGNYDIQITAVKNSKTSIARDERAFYLKA